MLYAILIIISSSSAFAMMPQNGQGGAGSMWSTIMMLLAFVFIFYFLMIRPQQKRQKEHQNMLSSLKKGDKVITNAGIHGTIKEIDGTVFTLQIADNVQVNFEKSAIVGTVEAVQKQNSRTK